MVLDELAPTYVNSTPVFLLAFTADWLRLLGGLGRSQTDALDYRVSAKIDFNGFVPTQRIEETGEITLK